uniref:T6SS Phospholipase effector Tle1-like catalytic domain-containing protein n=1 Tax=Rhizophagus irregularis (strain DAOM 181602 / DAOM 197198 / MUCL 43194) TaxID=747089 RepID=U9SFS2_RHIID
MIVNLGLAKELEFQHTCFRYLEFYDQTVPSIIEFACQALAIHENNAFFEPCRILPNKSGTIVKETWFPGVHSEIGENIGGLLMHDNIESYRARFSPADIGPSWPLRGPFSSNHSVL